MCCQDPPGGRSVSFLMYVNVSYIFTVEPDSRTSGKLMPAYNACGYHSVNSQQPRLRPISRTYFLHAANGVMEIWLKL